MRRLVFIVSLFLCLGAGAQIVNRLKVEQPIFLLYAEARMQEFSPSNLSLADSLYQVGVRQGNVRYKCLALSLEMPVRFARGEYERMDVIAAELKGLLQNRKDLRNFYYASLHEYNEFLLRAGRISEAVLEARAMERLALEEKNPLGRMYAYIIIGLIHSYRDNPVLAVENLQQALHFCREAREEQEMPNLYLLLAQEQVNLGDFASAHLSCNEAASYQDFFPGMEEKVLMTRALLYHAQGDLPAFRTCYELLKEDPSFTLQADADSRTLLDIAYLRSQGMLQEALARAGGLGNSQLRLEQQHPLSASLGDYKAAYEQLQALFEEKDSLFLKVQNEDLSILEAEMNNAQLREEAQRLKSRNQVTILAGFLIMFLLAFLSILLQQWRLRENLDQMRARNQSILTARKAYQNALASKETENELKIKLLQNKPYHS